MPGLRSSNIHVLDTQPDPRNPRLVKTINGKELSAKAGYSRPHTMHCGPDGVFLTCIGGARGRRRRAGRDRAARPQHLRRLRAWETDRGPQHFHYDAWWHLNQNVLISSEWGSPSMIENGVVPELLLGGKYGHAIHFWDLAEGRHLQRVDLGAQHQMVLEVRPSHDPEATWGFVGVVISTEDLSGSIWRWFRDGDEWKAEKVITHPGRARRPGPAAARAEALRRRAAADHRHRPVGRRPVPLRLLLGHRRAEAVRRLRPRAPDARSGSVRLGGIVDRAPHPARPDMPLAGGPQMVEVSRDGRRVYFTNSLYGAWDDQFYPDGVGAWMAKLDADPDRRAEHRRDASSRTASSSAVCACTRSGCRAATPPPTPTATGNERCMDNN